MCAAPSVLTSVYTADDSTATALLFLIGSAYFVCGSYPHAQQFYYAAGRGHLEQDPATASPGSSDPESAGGGGTHQLLPQTDSLESRGFQSASSLAAARRLPAAAASEVLNPLHGGGGGGGADPAAERSVAAAPASILALLTASKAAAAGNSPSPAAADSTPVAVAAGLGEEEAEDENYADDDEEVDEGVSPAAGRHAHPRRTALSRLSRGGGSDRELLLTPRSASTAAARPPSESIPE
jgi:hypothetical protein